MFALIQAAGWPIWFLIICSILALALVFEKFISLKSNKIIPNKLLQEVIDISSENIPSEQILKTLKNNSSLGFILAGGLNYLKENQRDLSEEKLRTQLENLGRSVNHNLERFLGALATIASAAPLLGLLGTVIGMIEIFGSQAGSGAIGSGNPTQLAHGISVALYNTAFGLIVAIPSLIFWRYFRSQINSYILNLEIISEDFLQHLLKLNQKINSN